ncbi:flagellar assembly lytic transglycosylase [Spirochaeta isovalerica]|uniref:Soluble lytic murein transglycosylase n=1 Tax=Spirochaeta isovalerica TaxID=150 RepID=A0A841RHY7_9SPIO|nr:lytic transglycosylase domain-containing protein [Spirochaeta isovalerica]MBB6482620.1 soluble lytic murein transglycosylase [Spirochaeta isovalerica]
MKKYLSLFLISFILFSCRASESPPSLIWGLEKTAIEESLRLGDLTFLDEVDLNRMDRKGRLGEISRLREGGAYYFSFIMSRQGEPEWQIRFLEVELLSGIYKDAAADELYRILSGKREWNRLSVILLNAYKEDRIEGRILDMLIEALFESGQSRKARQISGDDLLTLAAAKSHIREGGILTEEKFLRYVYGRATIGDSSEIFRLVREDNLYSRIPDSLKGYLELCYASAAGDRDLIDKALGRFVLNENLALQYPSLVYRMRLPFMQSSQTVFLAERLSTLSTFEASFTAGRLFRSEKKYSEADKSFLKAYDLAGSGFEKDRAMWYRMDLYSSNRPFLNGLIEEAAPLWSDPYYFSDVLEEHLSGIAAEARWDLLERIYPLIVQYGDRETAAAYSWVHLLSPLSERASEGERQKTIALMKEAPYFSFYYVLGFVLSGDEIPLAGSSPVEDERETDRFILGFYDFGLDEVALEQSRGREELLSDSLIRRLSNHEQENGDFLRSIQLSAYLMPSDNRPMTLEDVQLRYPRVFNDEIEQYSGLYGFPPEILKGIIRTESAFKHDIISHAGAVGLSQLMPATAADQARKLGIDDPDLTDPETNIRIGSSYVRWIIDRPWSDNLSQMLIAYNGGGGNLRKWKRMFPGYSDELFVEALPYKETRNYVKKVLTSSVVYGSVYGDENPADIIRKIYPDFDSLLEITGR